MTTSNVVYYITEAWLIMIFKNNSYTASDKHSVKNEEERLSYKKGTCRGV